MKGLDIIEIEPVRLLKLLKQSELPTSDIRSETSIFFAATNQKEIIGCIGLEILGSIGLLRSLAVKGDYRGQGIAKLLTKKVIESARSNNLETIYLLTTDVELFFEGIDFQKIVKTEAPQEIKDTKQYSEICSESAVVMKLELA
jgi:amino-acid N-acetyltransferase